MKTGIIEADTDGLPARDAWQRTGTAFRATQSDVLTANRQSLHDETATRDLGDSIVNFKVINVLIVGDCENEFIPRLVELEPKGYIPLHQRVETQEDYLAALKSRAWDVVISDHVLPQFSGPEALKLLRNQGSDIPFIMVSGVFGEEKSVIMIKAGANDYILKENLSRLVPAVERELKAAQDRRRCKSAERAMQHLAANIHELQKVVEHAVTRCGDNGTLEPEPFGTAKNNSGLATAAGAPAENGAATDMAGSSGEFPTLGELEKQHIFAALDRCQDNRNHAAALLNISARTLRNKLHKYNGTSPKPGPQAQNQADRSNPPVATESATSRGIAIQIQVDANNGHSRIFPEAANCETALSQRRIL
jgi:DNA-binding NtrC family response regulator